MTSMPRSGDIYTDSPGGPAGRKFSCCAYGKGFGGGYELADVPAQWWRKIVLDYGTGRGQLVLVYNSEPADSSELPTLMWKLQTAASRCGFTVTVILTDGTEVEAPPIGTGKRRGRKGGRR
jgi:hypothetical protein